MARSLANLPTYTPAVSDSEPTRAVLIPVKAFSDAKARLAAALKELGSTVSDADVIREVAIFAERSDIAEEIARLGGHVEQFRSIIEPANPQPAGRALDFLAQEMLREANTIASKSGDVEISRRVVEIKTAIDRIKEQAQNAE